MKRFLFVILAILAVVSVCACGGGEKNTTEYLRIHVRANSNCESDQNVKYVVKDAVVSYLTPYVKNCKSKAEAYAVLQSRLSEIDTVCEKTLEENGYFYGARAMLKSETFPTRAYGNLTLDEGVYDALIVELGTGKGDNWWCVVYPPLCFVNAKNNGSEKIVFKSKLAELFQKRSNVGD